VSGKVCPTLTNAPAEPRLSVLAMGFGPFTQLDA
jgi:hypothetical protein